MVTINGIDYCEAECVCNTHLLAAEIAAAAGDEITISMGDEGFDIVENGLEKIVFDVCTKLDIDTKKIVFLTNNHELQGKYFKFLPSKDFNFLNPMKNWINFDIPAATDQIRYGQFFSRPDNLRMYSFYKHISWEYADKGITTFHFDPSSRNSNEFYDFVYNKSEQWSLIKNYLPHNPFNICDTGINIDNNIIPPYAIEKCFTKQTPDKMYKDINVEIVVETNTSGKGFYITEKTLRPMLFKRLPLIVANVHFEKKLKHLGFDTFDDILDKTYDETCGYHRVDLVFSQLEGILKNKDILWFNSIQDRLNHNRQCTIEYLRKILDE